MRKFGLMALVLLLLTTMIPLHAQDGAATLVDDFDTGYEGGDLAVAWWSYVDDVGSTFTAVLDNSLTDNNSGSMRIDFALQPFGYAGAGRDFGFPRDYTAGTGLTMRIRATAAGLPASVVVHIQDETQTSTASPGVTPFGCPFETPAGSDQGWVTVTMEWGCFQRLMWVGDAGLMTFTPAPIGGMEIALDTEDGGTLAGSIWIDDIRVLSTSDLNIAPTAGEVLGDIAVLHTTQIGYRPDDAKYFISTFAAPHFSVIDEATGAAVYEGTVDDRGFDDDVQATIYRGSFDGLTASGSYHILLENGEQSSSFIIGDNVYDKALTLAARFLYLQRSGIAINDANSGVTQEAGHMLPAQLWGGSTETYDVSGGWYDAGDFGRYIPTAAFAVNQLLYAYEANPDVFADGTLTLPESGNGQPDLLDEIRWELNWMLKMQREDGAVHHKVTTRSYPGFGALTTEDTGQLFIFDVSSADTAYFAATLAQASTVFEAIDPYYASTLLAAAERAGAWLLANPDQVPAGGFQNPPVSEYPMQGGYDFVGVEDVPRLWAMGELFRATGNAAYDAEFGRRFALVAPDYNLTMSWANAYPQALYAYLTAENTTEGVRSQAENNFRLQSQSIYEVIVNSGYSVALDDSVPGFEYVWGSNQVALAHGLYLMLANDLFPADGYEAAASSQLQYIFGINPLAKSYLSGIGANPVMEPHHNLSYRNQRAVPGIVTEGANSQYTGGDAALQAVWDTGVPAAMRYIDDWDSWASNEPTIDANATFVALLAYFAG